MGKAVIDDLIVIEKLWKTKLNPSLMHNDEEAEQESATHIAKTCES